MKLWQNNMDDLVGQTFGKWFVLEELEERDSSRCKVYLCKCACGVEKKIQGTRLRNKRATMCNACAARQTKNALKHGHAKVGDRNPIYDIWKGMMYRAGRLKNYTDVSVCEAWKDVDNFISWAEDNGWKRGITLDRINPYGDYSPENCRLCTKEEQVENVRLLSKRNTSGFRGVSYQKQRGKWVAYCGAYGKQNKLGRFDSARDAAIVRDLFVLKHNIKTPLNTEKLYATSVRTTG